MDLVETLLQSTARVLREKGYGNTTTNAIAQQAGVSIGSLYQYFPNKESLAAKVFQKLIKSDLDFIAQCFAQNAELSMRESWSKFIRALFERYESDVLLRRVLVEQCSLFDGRDEFVNFKKSLTQLFYLEFCGRGLVLTEIRSLTIAFVVINALEGILRAAVITGEISLEREEILRETEQLIHSYINYHCMATSEQ